MPPNQAAYDDFCTPLVDWICEYRLYGSICVIDRREATTMRLAPVTLPPELKATRTESSIPNSRNAVTTDSSVRNVRVLLWDSAAQIRCRYFMRVAPRSPASGRLHLLDQRALFEVQRVRREF